MVVADVGVTLMPELAVPAKPAAGIRYIPFRGEIPHRDIGLCWRKSSTREPLLAELTELLVDTLS
jgi:LysR family hydrogen peroxide-inducible transcriptional activator